MSNCLKKKAHKIKASPPQKNVAPMLMIDTKNMSVQQISAATGAKVKSIIEWTDNKAKEIEIYYKAEFEKWAKEREQQLHEEYQKECREKLYKAENYTAVANILISLLAIKMSWGFTKANTKFISNLNAATEYVNRNGVKKVYGELTEQMGIDIAFDDMDINKEFGFNCTQAEIDELNGKETGNHGTETGNQD